MSIELKEHCIPCSELQVGMYVIRPDRPWLETDFLIQGFIIQSEDEIDAFLRQCEFVYVEAKIEKKAAPAKNERRKESLGLFARRRGKKGSSNKGTTVMSVVG